MTRGFSQLFRVFSSAGQKCFSSAAAGAPRPWACTHSSLFRHNPKTFGGRHLSASRPVAQSCIITTRLQHSRSAASSDSDEEPFERRRDYRKDLDIILPYILEGEPLTTEQWGELKRKVLDLQAFANEQNIDGIIMNLCGQHKQFKVGDSLLESIKESGKQPNLATLSVYLKMCYECQAGDIDTVLKICEQIRQEHPVMDANTAERVIYGLAMTPQWEEGIELLSTIRLTAVPSTGSFSALAKAAFDNGELQKGWDLIEHMLQVERTPWPAVYKSWIDQCSRVRGEESSVMIAELLNFWADHDMRPTLDVAQDLRQLFERDSYSWEGCFTELTPWGGCQSCNTTLRAQKVLDSEFEELRKHFFDRVLVDSSVFLKTNPEELETFQQFLARTAPYHVVIDGLNVAYSTRAKGSADTSKLLASVVRHFAVRSKRILVLGRRHMQKWPQQHMNYVHEHASVFLAQDLSQDDPFLLFAAMHSGARTQFLSRDLMRSHLFLLKEPALRRVFRRWQHQRQLQLSWGPGREPIIKAPLNYNPSVQQGPGSVWHVPYDLEYRHVMKQTYAPPQRWLCLQKMTPS